MSAPELLKLPLASKSRVSLLVYVHLWEGESEGGRRSNSQSWGQNCFDHAGVWLMSFTSLSDHLRYHYRCSSEWKASSRGSAFFLLQQYFLQWSFFKKILKITDWIADHRLIMLNILLSALLDPDRRLRSFRRSERLASILVCSTFIAWLGLVSVLCKDFLLPTLKLDTRLGSAWA